MPTITKVGRDSKRQTQYRKSMDLATRIVSVQIIEYWRVVFSDKQSDHGGGRRHRRHAHAPRRPLPRLPHGKAR